MKKRLITAGLAGILSLALVGCDDPDDGIDGDLGNGDTMITQTTLMPPATVPPTTGTG
ncbi:MAG TPA: hypothetical protein VLB85_15365 [Acidimicrobiia bacterium]|nr:hypothetical protein [Acidimicrobiia bacterium]